MVKHPLEECQQTKRKKEKEAVKAEGDPKWIQTQIQTHFFPQHPIS